MMQTRRRAAICLALLTAVAVAAPVAPAFAGPAAEPGGRIQYLSGIGYNDYSDLYQVRPDRSQRRLLVENLYDRGRLPDNAGADSLLRPAYSPDLRTVAYEAEDRSLWTARADGSNTRPILPAYYTVDDPYCEPNCWLTALRFSPDGRRIAAVEPGLSGARARVVVFDVDGSNFRVFPLPQGEGLYAMALQGAFGWSADGKRVAYAMGPEDSQRSAVFVTDVTTGATSQLTDARAWRSDAALSPDGRTVAFSATEITDWNYDADRDLYTVDVATRQVRRITTTADRKEYRPVFSPDGGWLAYDRHPTTYDVPVKPSVRRIAVDGTGEQGLDANGLVHGWLS